MQYNSPAMCNAFLQPVSLPPLPQRSPRLCRKRRPPMAASIHVGDLPARLGAAVAAVSAKSISQTGHFNVALSGGSLPRLLADALSVADATAIQLDKWRVFLADERIVPLEHADSNYKAIRDQLPRVDIVPIDPALAPEQCARDYQQKLVRSLGESPVFDAVLLGLGPDGHTCSLFPDHPLLQESSLLVASIVDSPKPPPQRVTLTLPVLNRAHAAMFVCTGAGKAPVVRDILENPNSTYPGHMVKPTNGTLDWFLDEPAAAQLSK